MFFPRGYSIKKVAYHRKFPGIKTDRAGKIPGQRQGAYDGGILSGIHHESSGESFYEKKVIGNYS